MRKKLKTPTVQRPVIYVRTQNGDSNAVDHLTFLDVGMTDVEHRDHQYLV